MNRVLRAIAAIVASLLALSIGALLLGAYVPAVPKVGVIGPVVAGQYPAHLAGFALVGVLLSSAAWRGGLVRWGRALTTVTAVSVAAALGIAGTQLAAAVRLGTDLAWAEVFTEPALPATAPDETRTYAGPNGQPLQVDAYLPQVAPGTVTPAIVLAHAGGFHTFDKSDLRGTARWLADHGVATFAVDYRLASASHPTWNEAPQDLVCALGWIRQNAARYHVDPSRVSLGGMSAGGTLAMGAAYRLTKGTITSSCGGTPAPPASVVGFYPGTDVASMWRDDVAGTRQAASWFTGGTPEEHPDRYREVSPTSDVRAGLPRTLLVVGDRDRSARPGTITAFANSLAENKVDVDVEVLPFAEHAFDDVYGSLVSQASRQVMLGFLTERPR